MPKQYRLTYIDDRTHQQRTTGWYTQKEYETRRHAIARYGKITNTETRESPSKKNEPRNPKPFNLMR